MVFRAAHVSETSLQFHIAPANRTLFRWDIEVYAVGTNRQSLLLHFFCDPTWVCDQPSCCVHSGLQVDFAALISHLTLRKHVSSYLVLKLHQLGTILGNKPLVLIAVFTMLIGEIFGSLIDLCL